MLIQLRITNHRSLHEEQTLSLVASSHDAGDPRLLRTDALGEALLPLAAIYGANASGKSNVFNALGFIARAVRDSHRLWSPDAPIPREPFALALSRGAPSVYDVEIIIDDVRYQYGFAVDDRAILEEWLYAWPRGRRQMLFGRDGQSFDFGKNLPGENKAIEGLTRSNSLFLSAAAQNNHERLTPIYRWFSHQLHEVRLNETSVNRYFWGATAWWLKHAARPEDLRRREQIQELLRSADLGILDFRVEEEERTISSMAGEPSIGRARKIQFRHRGEPADAWLGIEQESTGTLALVQMLPGILDTLEIGGVLVIDELNSMHPILALEILRLFQDPRRNANRAQLLFNTHDTTLLGNLIGESPLRRDQIWFTEKDQKGATHLYPLTDYHPRAVENLQRGYLQGRYGAVPFVGPLLGEPAANEDR